MPRSQKKHEHSKEDSQSTYPTSVYVPADLVTAVKIKYAATTGDRSFSHWVTAQMKEYLNED